MTEEVRSLDVRDREVAVDLLAAAFAEYPTMRWVLRPAGASYTRDLRTLLGLFCDSRLMSGGPILGVEEGGELLGVALIFEPGEDPMPPRLERLLEAVVEVIGEEAADRQRRADAAAESLLPAESHHYLGVLAVHPDSQRRGYGGHLVREVIDLARRHPESTGVGLNTETPGLVRYYRAHGFRVIGETHVEDLHTWAMFHSIR